MGTPTTAKPLAQHASWHRSIAQKALHQYSPGLLKSLNWHRSISQKALHLIPNWCMCCAITGNDGVASNAPFFVISLQKRGFSTSCSSIILGNKSLKARISLVLGCTSC